MHVSNVGRQGWDCDHTVCVVKKRMWKLMKAGNALKPKGMDIDKLG
jgi:hypothetical protein